MINFIISIKFDKYAQINLCSTASSNWSETDEWLKEIVSRVVIVYTCRSMCQFNSHSILSTEHLQL